VRLQGKERDRAGDAAGVGGGGDGGGAVLPGTAADRDVEAE
jgi:hypothetical protein